MLAQVFPEKRREGKTKKWNQQTKAEKDNTKEHCRFFEVPYSLCVFRLAVSFVSLIVSFLFLLVSCFNTLLFHCSVPFSWPVVMLFVSFSCYRLLFVSCFFLNVFVFPPCLLLFLKVSFVCSHYFFVFVCILLAFFTKKLF